MTGQDTEHPEDRETRINALLDGELDDAGSAALKAAAGVDRVLARALVDAWQLQRSMDELRLERAPAALRHKLRRIPLEHSNTGRLAFGQPPRARLPRALAGGVALAAVVVLSLVLRPQNIPPIGQLPVGTDQALAAPAGDSAQVEQARVEQARRDLKIAFHYLDKTGFRVGQQISEVLNDEVSIPIKENLLKTIPYTGQRAHKEKSA